MKLTKKQLRQFIKEELEQLDEMEPSEFFGGLYGGGATKPKVAPPADFDTVMARFIEALKPLLKKPEV